MEEVDNIIIHFLRQLNITIDDDSKQLSDLPVDVILLSISKCLNTINPSLKLSQRIPQGISHRIEFAAQLASMCKDMGYKNEVGYQTFLYYNEADLRHVFMFLIEHLPTEGKQVRPSLDPCDKKSMLYREISGKIDEEMNAIWIPYCCKPSNKNQIGDFVYPEDQLTTASTIAANVDCAELLQEFLEFKNHKIHTSPQKDVKIKAENKQIPMDRTIEVDTTKTLKQLKEEVITLRQKFNLYDNERRAANTEYAKIQKSSDQAEGELNSVQTTLQSLNTEDGVDDIINKIRKNINVLHSKSEALTSKNLSLKSEIDKIKLDLPQSQRSACKKHLLSLKEMAKSLKDEYNSKEELKEQLKKEFSKLSRANKRFIYTKRILEIISNVDKQNLDIKKVLEDTRELQKEINTLEGQLDRCFSLADETLFKDAKKDDQAKKAYKLLALLHSECNTIVTLVNDTGTLSREIVDLEDHIKVEKMKQTEETLKRIQNDLSKMQEEHYTT